MKQRQYTGIEIGRVLFACLIPLLHISFSESIGIEVIRQYFSRLGVSYFYAVSGMFLGVSFEKRGRGETFKQYEKKIARLLLIWLAIYSPIFIAWKVSIQEIIFKTPAYLWYLTGLLFAAIPFCFIGNKKVKYILAVGVYIFGTLFGDTYRWLMGGVPLYEKIFITTRNGLFFGFPMMCIGEASWHRKGKTYFELLISTFIFICEVTFVGIYASATDDRSMYFSLPFFIFFLLSVIRNWNPNVDVKGFGKISTAIYLMQFGIITVFGYIFKFLDLPTEKYSWLIYMCTILFSLLGYLVVKNKKAVNILF